MCKDCGCSVTTTGRQKDGHNHDGHDHEHNHDGHEHNHDGHDHEHNHDDHEHNHDGHDYERNHDGHDHEHNHDHPSHKMDHKSIKMVQVAAKILEENDRQAEENRRHFDEHHVLAINLMSSPGSGKTTLLEKTVELLKDTYKIGVIEGDLETDRDAQRIRAKGVPAHQINTGQACHLDAFMVHQGIHHLPIENLDIVFIENVGNLVCPASYSLGTHIDVVLLSVTEGDDKPAKYPVIFRTGNLLLITKTDLLPYLKFSVEDAIREARKVNPQIDVLPLSAVSGEGMKSWCDFLILKKTLRYSEHSKASKNAGH